MSVRRVTNRSYGDVLKDLRWLWKTSKPVCEGRGLRGLRDRLRFVLSATRLMAPLRHFIHPPVGSALERLMLARPETVGAVVWPYQCLGWDAVTRLERIESHCKAIDALGAGLDFRVDQAVQLLNLDNLSPGLRVVLDQPRWFMREGQLAINLFAGGVRIYTLAFSFGFLPDGLAAYVGAIQGANTAGIQDGYKELTKALHGMRPRDFLVELFRTFCRCLDVLRIYAVADESRQHRSKYFGAAKASTLTLNYDDIWVERGGVRANEDFFVLAPEAPDRSLEDVPSKKRAMYRRRYEMLAEIEQRLGSTIRADGGFQIAASAA